MTSNCPPWSTSTGQPSTPPRPDQHDPAAELEAIYYRQTDSVNTAEVKTTEPPLNLGGSSKIVYRSRRLRRPHRHLMSCRV
jgi:hypothetical protein